MNSDRKTIHEELKHVFENTTLDPESLVRLVELLPGNLHELPNEIVGMFVDVVPQIADLLHREIDDRTWLLHDKICSLLAFLGPRAQASIPALFEHLEKVPRLELNAIAIGKIGGPDTTRRLIRWTYWQGSTHDRKRTDAVCTAIRMLGDAAIEELLELTGSGNSDPHERASALLNLLENTAYPRERLIPLFARELDRNPSIQCFEALVPGMKALGEEFPELVLAAIEPLLRAEFSTSSIKAKHYVAILEKVGTTAKVLLRELIDQGIHREAALQTLKNIDGDKNHH